MNDTIYGAIIGFIATISGTAITLFYQYLASYRAERKLKAALLEMFIASVSSYENALRLELTASDWNSNFWDRCQLEVAKYFPEEAVEFNKIIFNTSSFLRPLNSASSLERLLRLKATLLAEKSRM